MFLAIYYLIHLLYCFGLDDGGKQVFETIVRYFNKQSTFIPLSFLLGFYVATIITRWWNQYQSIPWTTGIAVLVTSLLNGKDERARMMRRTIMRYACLSLTMVLRGLSPSVKIRFPEMSDLIKAGLINDEELLIIQNAEERFPGAKNWFPIKWAAGIVIKAKEEGFIKHDLSVMKLLDELNKYRGLCGALMAFNTISVPLVYTQVVTIAVYSYFLISLIGKQAIEGDNKRI